MHPQPNNPDDELLEVAPAVWKRFGECTSADLQGYLAVEEERLQLLLEGRALRRAILASAADLRADDIPVPAGGLDADVSLPALRQWVELLHGVRAGTAWRE